MYGTFSENDMAVDTEKGMRDGSLHPSLRERRSGGYWWPLVPLPFFATGTYRGRVTGRLKDIPAPEGCFTYFCGNCDRIHAEVCFLKELKKNEILHLALRVPDESLRYRKGPYCSERYGVR